MLESIVSFSSLYEFVRRFLQTLQMSSFKKNVCVSTENVCEQWEITNVPNNIKQLKNAVKAYLIFCNASVFLFYT